jgi:opacity protein-like surface antigen
MPAIINFALMRKLLPVFILLCIACNVQAQSWEIGGSVGGAGYMGDLNPNNPLKMSGGTAGLMVKRNFNEYLSASIHYSVASIAGADSTSSNPQFVNRNLSFKTPLSEISLVGELNFLKYIPSVTANRFTPYVFAGAGLTTFKPQTVYQGQTFDLAPFKTEGQTTPYSNKAISAIYGAGIKYNFSGALNIIADIGYRHAFTDYLDDVSGVYPDPTSLSGNLAISLSDRSLTPNAPGSQRGDFRPHDNYLFINLTISFTFITAKCCY